jgi:eukaryotic-like serine/threonine-protein kinase
MDEPTPPDDREQSAPRDTEAASAGEADSCTIVDLQDGATKKTPGDPDTTAIPLSRPPSLPVVPGFEILGELGRGNMGVVYKARQVRLNRLCALKMILPDRRPGVKEVMRFQAEAEAVAKIQHPNIIQIYQVDEYEGLPYFAMEFVAGGSLVRTLDGMPLPPMEAARLVESLAHGMTEAHRVGIVHRDLKPGNVLLAADGLPKVSDFGIAKFLDADFGLTHTNEVMGSPSYMAPEQADGMAKNVGPAADIYALGAIIYELLVGRPPFRGATLLDTLRQVKTTEPVAPSRLVPGLPRTIETITLKCLQKEPARRYASALALAEDLRRFQSGEPIMARPVSSLERTWLWCRRNPRLATASTLAIIGLLAVTVISSVWAVVLKQERDQKATLLEESQRLTAGLSLERGLDEFERGAPDHGLLWLARGLRQAPETAGDLRHALRANLGAWRHRVNRLLASIAVQDGDSLGGLDAPVSAFDLTGKRFVSSDGKDGARFWDVPSGAPVGPTFPHGSRVIAVVLSPDSRWVATVGANRSVMVWDSATGEPRGHPLAHRVRVSFLAFSPDGQSLVTAGTDWDAKIGEARIWDLTSGTLRYPPLDLGSDFVPARVRFGATGATLVFHRSGSDSVMVCRWDAAKGQFLANGVNPNPGRNERLNSAFGQLREFGVIPRADRTENRPPETSVKLEDVGIPFPVRAEVSLDGTRIAWINDDDKRSAMLYDLTLGQPLERPQQENVVALAFRRDARVLATADTRTIRYWDASTGKSVGQSIPCEGDVGAFVFSPDGATLLVISKHAEKDRDSREGMVRLLDARTGRPVGPSFNHSDSLKTLRFSHDGSSLIAVENDRVVFRGIATGLRLGQPVPQESSGPLALDPLGGSAMTTVKDARGYHRRLWSLVKDSGPSTVFRGKTVINFVAFDPCGKFVLTAGTDSVQLHDLNSGRVVLAPPEGKDSIGRSPYIDDENGYIFSPDGARVAQFTGVPFFFQNGEYVSLWDPTTALPIGRALGFDETGQPIVPRQTFLKRMRQEVKTVMTNAEKAVDRVTVDLEELAKAGREIEKGAIQPEEAQKRVEEIAKKQNRVSEKSTEATPAALEPVPKTDPAFLRLLGFSPDGRFLAVVIKETIVRLIDTRSGQPSGPPLAHDGLVSQAVLSAGGGILATGGEERIVSIWNTSSGERLGRPVPLDEKLVKLVFAPNGSSLWIFAGSTARRWDPSRGRILGVPMAFPDALRSVFVSPDGRTALICRDKECRLFDLASGEWIGKPLEQGGATGAHFSPDGATVLLETSAGSTRSWRLWNLRRSQPVGNSSIGYEIASGNTAFSRDGTIFASALDGVTRFLDTSTARPVGPPIPTSRTRRPLGFCRDGRFITTEGRNLEYWDAPAPVTLDPAIVELWAEVITGQELRPDGEIRSIDVAKWQSLRQELDRQTETSLP